jgi:hypothetical protein
MIQKIVNRHSILDRIWNKPFKSPEERLARLEAADRQNQNTHRPQGAKFGVPIAWGDDPLHPNAWTDRKGQSHG